MSKSNENNPHLIQIPLATGTGATASVAAFYARKKMIIRQVSLLSGKTAATATNTLKVCLKNGTATIAEVNSAVAGGEIDPVVAKLCATENIEVAAGSSLHVKVEGAGTSGVINGVLCLEAYRA